MKLKLDPRIPFSAMAAGTLLLTACSVQAPTGASANTSSGGSTTSTSVSITGPNSVPKANENKPLNIAFFGFARANSFASATFAGIQDYASKHNAKAEFFDPNFDAQKQASQIQDAVTSKRFNVFVLQANDGTAVIPAVEQAISAGIPVVVEFTPIGTKYDTQDPQVAGTITLIDVPTKNGKALGDMGVAACKKTAPNPCKVAYLEGFKSLPLDNARTKAVANVLNVAPGVKLVMSVEGGYTNDSGRKAMQDVLQAHPDVNVVIGSSQAIAGAAQVAGANSKIAFIGNGGSRQAVDAVRAGRWFGTWCLPETTSGATAAALGLAKARGANVPTSNSETLLSPIGGLCTASTVANVQGEYNE